MENRKNWYLISTKSGCELKVAQTLKRLNVLSYVPVRSQSARLMNSKRIGCKTLFPSFVFVFASEQDHLRIKRVDNVVSIMYWLNKPVIVRNEEIINLQNFLKNHKDVTVEKLGINYSNTNSRHIGQDESNDVFEIEDEAEKLVLSSIGYTLIATSSVQKLLEVA